MAGWKDSYIKKGKYSTYYMDMREPGSVTIHIKVMYYVGLKHRTPHYGVTHRNAENFLKQHSIFFNKLPQSSPVPQTHYSDGNIAGQ